jgi:hypothetical protein
LLISPIFYCCGYYFYDKNKNSFTITFVGKVRIATGYRLIGCRSIDGMDKDSSEKPEAFAAANLDKSFPVYQPCQWVRPS